MPYLKQLDSKNWRAVYRGADGKRKSITRPTKSEARTEALEMEAQIRRGTWHDPTLGKMPFGEWVDIWKKGRIVEEATTRKNESHLKVHILPRWKPIRLDGITPDDVQEWIAGMNKADVGAETVHSVNALFGRILERAVRGGRIRANPAKGMELPTISRQPERFLSKAEVGLIMAKLAGQDKLMVEMASETGMRWAEITGLHVKRVDLAKRLVHVVEVATRSGHVKDYPKSKRSFRTLPLTSALVKSLRAQIKDKRPEDLVFQSDPDAARSHEHSIQMIDYTNWRRRVFVDAVADSGVAAPLPTFHDLRHSYVSRLIAGGVDIVTVQRKAGHESLLTTQKYSHLAPGADDKVRAVLEARDTPQTHGAKRSRPRKSVE